MDDRRAALADRASGPAPSAAIVGVGTMARRKNLPEAVRVKCRLSERLHEVRVELFGDRGGSEMARRLNLPVRTWYNYESGVTVPAEVLLRFMELTAVEPMWLLHGRGPKFRQEPVFESGGSGSVRDLLRTALRRLEEQPEKNRPAAANGSTEPDVANGEPSEGAESPEVVLIRVEGTDRERLTGASGPRYLAARREWMDACRDCRCLRIEGEAMAPILENGAYVTFSDTEEPADQLVGSLVVAWIDGQPLVRWFEISGRYGMLRAENPTHEPGTVLLDLDAPPHERVVRRVLWISTPH